MSEAMNDLGMQERFQQYLDQCRRIIQERGYMVQGVGGDEGYIPLPTIPQLWT